MFAFEAARCAFFDRNVHSRMPLIPTPARLKRAGGHQWHSSRVSTFLTSSHCKLRPNTEGCQPKLGGFIVEAVLSRSARALVYCRAVHGILELCAGRCRFS
jgi:hypothetical protein